VRRPRLLSRRGSVALVIAIVLLGLVGAAALVVDLGYARLVQSQLQSAADASALGGVRLLDGTNDGLVAARAATVAVASLNEANGDTVVLDANAGNSPEGDVCLGVWDAEARSFTPSDDANEVNAIQVIARNGNLTPMLSRVAFERDQLGAAARSIATLRALMGAGKVPYYIPFGLPVCLWEEYSDPELEDQIFTLSPAGMDNTGWATVGGHPNASWISSHLNAIGPCMEEWQATGEVSDDCAVASTESTVGLSNGMTTAGLMSLADAIESGPSWDAAVWGPLPNQAKCSSVDKGAYGGAVVGPLPVFDGGGDYCSSSAPWNDTRPLLGFAWAAVYDVCAKGSAATKNVFLKVDMSHIYPVGTWYGGDDFGVVSISPGVVVQ
jgi:Flp pilus assembly protein TadG